LLKEDTLSCASAFRLAYMSITLDVENGQIEGFDYNTYQSTGSAYGDMFSRPMPLDDREDEAIDMLLYLLDKCR